MKKILEVLSYEPKSINQISKECNISWDNTKSTLKKLEVLNQCNEWNKKYSLPYRRNHILEYEINADLELGDKRDREKRLKQLGLEKQ